MTPGATANVRQVISSSLRTWIIESLEQFGVDSLVFLHVIQSILEQDIQSLRGEDSIEDFWKRRLASTGSRRAGRDSKKLMNKEDLQRCVLLENMRPCFKEDESDFAEEFVDELLHRWNEETTIRAEACRGLKGRSQCLPEDVNDERKKETRDPVTAYNEAFPALVAPTHPLPGCYLTSDLEVPSGHNGSRAELGDILYTSRHNLKTRSRKETTGYRVRQFGNCRKVTDRYANKRLYSNNPQKLKIDSVRPNIHRDRRRQSSNNAVCFNLNQDGRAFENILDRLFSSNAAKRSEDSALSAEDKHATRKLRDQPFAKVPPQGFLRRTIEKIISSHEAMGGQNASTCGVGDASYGCVRSHGRRQKFPIYMENELGVLMCLDDYYCIDDENAGYCIDVDNAGNCSSLGSGCSVMHEQRLTETSKSPVGCQGIKDEASSRDYARQDSALFDPKYSGVNLRPQNDMQHYGAGRLLLMAVPGCVTSESQRRNDARNTSGRTYHFDDDGRNAVPLPAAEAENRSEDWEQESGMAYFASHVTNLGVRLGNASSTSALHPSHNTAALQGRITSCGKEHKSSGIIQNSCLKRSLVASDDMPSSGSNLTYRASSEGDVSNHLAGTFGAVSYLNRYQAVKESKKSDETLDVLLSTELIADLIAEISERDLMNHIAASLAPLFPDVLVLQPLYLPEADILTHNALQCYLFNEPGCLVNENELSNPRFCAGTYQKDYWFYLYMALGRDDVRVDHILNYDDFCCWRLCVLRRAATVENSACICGMCSRALRTLVNSRYAFVEQPLNRNKSPSGSPSWHKSFADYGPELPYEDYGSNLVWTPSFVGNDWLSNSSARECDFHAFTFGAASELKGISHAFGFTHIGRHTPLPKYGQDSDIFNWSTSHEIQPDDGSEPQSRLAFGKEQPEENNNQVLEYFNMVEDGSKSGNADVVWTNCEKNWSIDNSTVAACPPSLRFSGSPFGGEHDTPDNFEQLSADGTHSELELKSSSPSSVAFDRLLSSGGDTSSESFQLGLREDIYSLWLNAAPCNSCKACLSARYESPLRSDSLSSNACSSNSDSDVALNFLSHLWNVEDADTASATSAEEKDALDNNDDAFLSVLCKSEVQTEDLQTSPRDSEIQLFLDYSCLQVPSEPSSSNSVGTDDDVDFCCAASPLSLLSADSSVNLEEADGSNLSSLGPYSAESIVDGNELAITEGFQKLSVFELGQKELEDIKNCAAEDKLQKSDLQELADANISWDQHEPRSESCQLCMFSRKDAQLEGNFKNLEQLKFIWEEQGSCLEKQPRTTSCWDMVEANSENSKVVIPVCNATMPDVEALPLFRENQKPKVETSKEPAACDLNPGGSDLKKFTSCSSSEEAELEKLKLVKHFWDCQETGLENFMESKSRYEKEEDDSKKFRDLKFIWERREPKSEALQEPTSFCIQQEHGSEESCAAEPPLDPSLENLQEVSSDPSHPVVLRDSRYLATLLDTKPESLEDLGRVPPSVWERNQPRADNLDRFKSCSNLPNIELQHLCRAVESEPAKLEDFTRSTPLWGQTVAPENQENPMAPDGLSYLTGMASKWERKEFRSEEYSSVVVTPSCNLDLPSALGSTFNTSEQEAVSGKVSTNTPDWDVSLRSSENLIPRNFSGDEIGVDNKTFDELKLIWEEPQGSTSNQGRPFSCQDNDEPETRKFEEFSTSWSRKQPVPQNLKTLLSFEEDQQDAQSSYLKNLPYDLGKDGADTGKCEELKFRWDGVKTSSTTHKAPPNSFSEHDSKSLLRNDTPSNWDDHQTEVETFVIWEDQQNLESRNLSDLKAIWECEPPTNMENENWSASCWDEKESKGLTDVQNFRELKSIWAGKEPISEKVTQLKSFSAPKAEMEDLTGADRKWDFSRSDADGFRELKSAWDKPQQSVETNDGSVSRWNGMNLTADGVTKVSLMPAADKNLSESIKEPKSIWDDRHLKERPVSSYWNRLESESQRFKEPTHLSYFEQLGEPSNLEELKSIWEEQMLKSESSKQVMSAPPWEQQDQNSENLARMVPCWNEDQTSAEALISQTAAGDKQLATGNFKDLNTIWEGKAVVGKDFSGLSCSWTEQEPQAADSFQGAALRWNNSGANLECFQVLRFNLDCRKPDSENSTEFMSAGEMKKSNSEVFHAPAFGSEREIRDWGYFRGGTSGGNWPFSGSDDFRGLMSNLDLWRSESDELKWLISHWNHQPLESKGFKSLLTDHDLRHHDLATEWQLAEAFSLLKTGDASVAMDADFAVDAGVWRMVRRNQGNVLKLVPSENTAFSDKIPRRFVYRYSFFDPRDANRDILVRDARTETIKHIYDPSNSIVRQLEDIFDDGQRLHSEDAFKNLPNRMFRPIGGRNSGRDSRHSNGTPACGTADMSSLILEVGTPIPDPTEPESPYQLYLGVESDTFAPRFRVHTELEKSAQTGEATPPMQNNESVCGMNVILSTMALLD